MNEVRSSELVLLSSDLGDDVLGEGGLKELDDGRRGEDGFVSGAGPLARLDLEEGRGKDWEEPKEISAFGNREGRDN